MTSKLKQCDWCGAYEKCADESCPLNTRAVPVMPELVRYDLTYNMPFGEDADISEIDDGEFVRYDQAAEMLERKDLEIKQATKKIEEAWYNAEGKISDLQHENNILKSCLRDIYPILENCKTGRYKSIKDLIDRVLKGNVL